MFQSRLAAAREKLKGGLGVEAAEEQVGKSDTRRSYGTLPRKTTAARRLSSEETELVRADIDADDEGVNSDTSRPTAVRKWHRW
eukprot:792150-Prymnesium_polylepis.1